MALLIPESESERLETGHERNWLDGLKEWLGVVAFLEVVIGDARAEVVDMMEADVAGEPLENFRQFIKRAAAQCGSHIIPLALSFPINPLELVLNVKEPDTSRTRHHQNSKLD